MTAPLRILAGPTAAGKSALAAALAARRGGSVLSADSMQVYRGLPVGTAQPSEAERLGVPHHLVGHVEPGEEYHVARFVSEARAILDEEERNGRPVVVCGGTGLFLRHLVEGIFEGAPRDPVVRERLEEEYRREGLDAMRERLRSVDPVREAEINPNDWVRVLRALEVFETTGVPMSEHHARDVEQRTLHPACYLVLDVPRKELNARIERRVDAMLDAGWLEEARWLLERGLPDSSQACKALGYRELFGVLRGERTLEEAREEIKQRTRRFAKRQLTWFRGVRIAEWVSTEGKSPDELIEEIEARLFGAGTE